MRLAQSRTADAPVGHGRPRRLPEIGELTGLKALVTGGASGIAHAVLSLAFPRAGSTTGAEIEIDGGMAGLRLRPRT
jgi:hypothetical protein